MLNNKRGILPAKVVAGLIIAAIGIVILIFLIVSLSSLISSSHQKEQAEGQLKLIMRALSDLDTGSSSNFLLRVPEGLFLVGHPALKSLKSNEKISVHYSKGSELKTFTVIPHDKCAEGNCICICKKQSDDVLDCKTLGVCAILPVVPLKYGERTGENYALLLFEIGYPNLINNVFVEKKDNAYNGDPAYIFDLQKGIVDLNRFFADSGEFEKTTVDYYEEKGAYGLKDRKKEIINPEDSDDESYFYHKLKEYFDTRKPYISTSSADPNYYIISHILMKINHKYDVNPLIILSILDAESGFLSKDSINDEMQQKPMGDLSKVTGDDLCKTDNFQGIKDEIDRLKISEDIKTKFKFVEQDKENAKSSDAYLKILDDLACGAKKLKMFYGAIKDRKDSKILMFDKIIGDSNIKPEDEGTAAVFYYLYYNENTGELQGEIDKALDFWNAYNRLKSHYTSLEWTEDYFAKADDLKDLFPGF